MTQRRQERKKTAMSKPDPGAAAIANAGGLVRAGRVEEALGELEAAVDANPAAFDVRMVHGELLLQLGQARPALAAFEAAGKIDANRAEAHYCIAGAQDELGRAQRAIAAYRRAIEINPDFLEAWFDLGGALADAGDLSEAIDCYRQATRLGPKMAEAHHGLGAALLKAGEGGPAIDHLERALALRPDFPEALFELGNALRGERRIEPAAARFGDAIALRPSYAEAYLNRAGCLQMLGEFDEARRLLESAIARKPDLCEAHHELVRARRITEADRPIIARIETLLADKELGEKDRCNLHFALGKAYDDLGERERAFENFASANRLKRATLDYDPAKLEDQFGEICRTFDAAFFAARRGYGDPCERPVFLVGMPRSGTTLVEQILASHGQIFGAGELPIIGRLAARLHRELGVEQPYPACADTLDEAASLALAQPYLEHLRALDGEAARVTDKMPSNFIHLGLIALLFPNSRIIHCRRIPADTCLSCYFQNFSLPLRFAYDLRDLGHYHRQYERLMAHWKAVLPLPIHDIEYEALIADPQKASREIIAFCGLEWDEACLRPHEHKRTVDTASVWQVRQPIYNSSVEKWRAYEKHLGPLLDALAGKPGASN